MTCRNVQKQTSLFNEKLTRANALQEEQDISSEAESFPSMEHTTYNLEGLFTTVGHPEEHIAQLEAEGPSGVTMAPGMHEVKGQGISQDGED